MFQFWNPRWSWSQCPVHIHVSVTSTVYLDFSLKIYLDLAVDFNAHHLLSFNLNYLSQKNLRIIRPIPGNGS